MKVFTFFLLILAVLITLLRVALPWMSQNPQMAGALAQILSEASDAQVEVAQLNASWWGFWPRIQMSDIRIQRVQHPHAQAVIEHVTLWLDPVQSLRSGRWQVRHIRLHGADIQLGIAAMDGIDPPVLDPLPPIPMALLERFSRVAWDLRDVHLQLSGWPGVHLPQLHGRLHRGKLQLGADLALLSQPKQTLHLALEGFFDSQGVWHGRGYLHTPALHTDSLHALAAIADGWSALGTVQTDALHLWAEWQAGYLQQWQAQVAALHLAPQGDLPGIGALDLQLHGTPDAIQIAVEAQQTHLALPMLADPVAIQQLSALLTLRQQGGQWLVQAEQLRVENADIGLSGQFLLSLGTRTYLDLAVQFYQGNGSRVAVYLPEAHLSPATYQWLCDSIIDADIRTGELLWSGYVDAFPFAAGEGLFQVRADIAQGILDYQPGWPRIEQLSGELIFQNSSLFARGVQGVVQGLRITDGAVLIKDLEQAQLEIRADLSGPATAMQEYLQQAALLEALRPLMLQGPAQLALALQWPLEEDIDSLRLQGRLQLPGNPLRWGEVPLTFEALQGTVFFDEQSAHGRRLSAQLHGQPAVLDLAVDASQGVQLKLFSRQDPAVWLNTSEMRPLVERIQGLADWQADLLWMPDGTGHLTLRSDLQGVSVDLPAPLHKAAKEAAQFKLQLPLDIAPGAIVELDYAPQMAARLAFDHAGQIPHLQLHFGAGAQTMRNLSGIVLSGVLTALDLDGWQQLLEAFTTDTARPENPLQTVQQLRDVDLVIEQLHWRGGTVEDIQLQTLRQDSPQAAWQMEIASPLLTGRLSLPAQRHAESALILQAAWLDLNQWKAPHGAPLNTSVRLDPRQLPALHLHAEYVLLDTLQWEDVRLVTQTLRDGLHLEEFAFGFAPGQSRVQMSGEWRVLADDRHHSSGRGRLETADLGQSLSKAGFAHSFDRGSGEIELRLSWPDAPTHFTWEGLQGYGRIQLRDGALKQVEPGAGRLLGLFSLQLIPRRLALDFRDLFNRGFSFDRIQGDFVLAGSDLYTAGLKVQGPVAQLRIEGRTGIVAQDYDQSISVTPNVTASLPLATALLGGPVAGLTVFVFDQVAGLGERIDEVARVDYRLTGAWDNPIIQAKGWRARREQKKDSLLAPSDFNYQP
ncbi:YhdP family protein [Thiorhodospira sibirica]|uniref:YhdP family protein n=1 Tax=Thiorhodospira sibirica TaxID=154347 RepID=UPI00022C52C7|nr:YhdP family protein [Thiorhodospira sibirica]